jgi:SAM-dependent MidA family methyltransferase
MPAESHVAPLAAILADRIRAHGPITFAEYMEACLYHPQHGYYTKAGQNSRRDYFTSVDVHPLFARLLARQFVQMWEFLGHPDPFLLVEAGAGTGALACDILSFARETVPAFYSALVYETVEKSEARRALQSSSLAPHLVVGKAFVSAQMPPEIACGCIFSNEFFDAMPVHRLIGPKGHEREIFVDVAGNEFREVIRRLSNTCLSEYLVEQGIVLAVNQQAEICLEACRWMKAAGRSLKRGFVLTVDYGHEAAQLYDGRHMRGTLLAYTQHRADENYFRAPGEQDLTAHVNFTALDRCGSHAGLIRTGFTSQTNFLMALARHSHFADLQSSVMNEQQQARARLLFKTLIYPEGMGETFHVLVQHKGIDAPRLAGLEPL